MHELREERPNRDENSGCPKGRSHLQPLILGKWVFSGLNPKRKRICSTWANPVRLLIALVGCDLHKGSGYYIRLTISTGSTSLPFWLCFNSARVLADPAAPHCSKSCLSPEPSTRPTAILPAPSALHAPSSQLLEPATSWLPSPVSVTHSSMLQHLGEDLLVREHISTKIIDRVLFKTTDVTCSVQEDLCLYSSLSLADLSNQVIRGHSHSN